jgi:hypothetical protein
MAEIVYALLFLLVCLIIGSRKRESGDGTIINTERNDEVTIEDMVLHDMNNTDDTYDIGTIDFND